MARKIVLLLVLLFSSTLSSSSPAHADQSPSLRLGRTNQVTTERRQFGDINTTLYQDVYTSSAANVYGATVTTSGSTVTTTLTIYNSSTNLSLQSESASCNGSLDSTCVALATINSCSWSSLNANMKSAITYILGSCSKSCVTVNQTLPWGETSTTYQWACQNPATAECLMSAGLIGRIDLIQHGTGCN